MIAENGRRFARFLRSSVGVVTIVAWLLLLPLGAFALMRMTGWPWWAALIGAAALNIVPVIGQVVYFGFAVAGAFYVGLDDLDRRRAAAAAVAPAAVNAEVFSREKFERWRREVFAPQVQNECLNEAKRKGIAADDRVSERAAKVCECYRVAALSVVTEADVVGETPQLTQEFNSRLTDEAQRLCIR